MRPIPKPLMKRPFSAQGAIRYGLSRDLLTRMVQAGVLERLSRGVYQVSGADEGALDNQYRVATLRCGNPSAICLLSALEHYHVTDQITKKTWVMVPEPKRIQSPDLRLVRSRRPQWNVGIRKTRHYWITTLERTLVDCLLQKRVVSSQVALDAIRTAVAEKKVTLGQIYDMAKKMGIEGRIRPTIEVLAS